MSDKVSGDEVLKQIAYHKAIVGIKNSFFTRIWPQNKEDKLDELEALALAEGKRLERERIEGIIDRKFDNEKISYNDEREWHRVILNEQLKEIKSAIAEKE